jgi:hypothetical protein
MATHKSFFLSYLFRALDDWPRNIGAHVRQALRAKDMFYVSPDIGVMQGALYKGME